LTNHKKQIVDLAPILALIIDSFHTQKGLIPLK